jgi:hypothetical protein
LQELLFYEQSFASSDLMLGIFLKACQHYAKVYPNLVQYADLSFIQQIFFQFELVALNQTFSF